MKTSASSRGDTFLEKHLVALDVPQKRVGFLNESAVLYEDRFTVIGLKAVREYQTGDVILLQELKTPPAELNLNPNEDAVWIPVDGGSFVSSLVSPGDMVSFYVAAPSAKASVPAASPLKRRMIKNGTLTVVKKRTQINQ